MATRRVIAAALAGLTVATGLAAWGWSAAPLWTIDRERSQIGFEATQMGARFQGTFEIEDAVIAFDPDTLSSSKAMVTVDVTSLETGNTERNETALGQAWFAADEYPEASFVADTFSRLDDTRLQAEGQLTLRGVTRPVDFPFELRIIATDGGREARINGEIAIQRTDYGIGQGEWATDGVIGDRVVIRIRLVARSAR